MALPCLLDEGHCVPQRAPSRQHYSQKTWPKQPHGLQEPPKLIPFAYILCFLPAILLGKMSPPSCPGCIFKYSQDCPETQCQVSAHLLSTPHGIRVVGNQGLLLNNLQDSEWSHSWSTSRQGRDHTGIAPSALLHLKQPPKLTCSIYFVYCDSKKKDKLPIAAQTEDKWKMRTEKTCTWVAVLLQQVWTLLAPQEPDSCYQGM